MLQNVPGWAVSGSGRVRDTTVEQRLPQAAERGVEAAQVSILELLLGEG